MAYSREKLYCLQLQSCYMGNAYSFNVKPSGKHSNHSAINGTWESAKILTLKCGSVADKSYFVFHTRLRYNCQQMSHVSNWSAGFHQALQSDIYQH